MLLFFVDHIAHGLINIFSAGRSDVRVYLFVVWAVIFACIYLIRPKMRFPVWIKWAAVGLVSLSFVLNLAGFMWYSYRYALPLNTMSVVYNNEEISSNRLVHSHILKGSAGLVAEAIGIRYAENADLGIAELGILPDWFFVLGLFGSIFSILAAILLYIHQMGLDTLRGSKIYLVSYIVLTFSMLEGIIDGGIMSSHIFVAYVMFVAVVLCADPRRRLVYMALSLPAYAVICLILYGCGMFADISEVAMFVSASIALYCLMIVLFYVALKGRFDRLAFLLTILTVISIMPVAYSVFNILGYDAMSLSQHGAVVGLYGRAQDKGLSVWTDIGQLAFYSVGTSTALSIGDIVRKYDILDNLYPVSIPWVTCLPGGRWDMYKFRLTSAGPLLDPEQRTDAYSYRATLIQARNGRNDYAFDIRFAPCLTRHINIVDEIMRKEGMRRFIIYGIHFDGGVLGD